MFPYAHWLSSAPLRSEPVHTVFAFFPAGYAPEVDRHRRWIGTHHLSVTATHAQDESTYRHDRFV